MMKEPVYAPMGLGLGLGLSSGGALQPWPGSPGEQLQAMDGTALTDMDGVTALEDMGV